MTARLIALSMATLPILSACSDKQEPAPAPRLVQTIILSKGSGVTSSHYPGSIVSRYEARLGFRVAGTLVAKLVDVGTSVRTGQALARLDPSDARLSVDSSAAQTGAAASAAQQQAVDMARARRLLADGFISPAEFDRQKVGRDQAAAQLRSARAQQAGAQRQLDYTILRAERGGVVTAFDADVGQVLAAGQPVATVAAPGQLEALVSIPEGELGAFRRAALRVNLWGQPGATYPGRIRTLSPVANPQTRTFEARVAIIGDPRDIPIGATAEVLAGNPVSDATLRVPVGAVTQIGDKASVWVVSGNPARVTPRAIRIVQIQQNGVLIAGNVRAGERVVTAGVNLLHSGDPVRIADARGADQ
ncbi:efflux RND transporter periplasmic adaptor subunit [Sphingomonas sp.]|uniref:efflux RND transporter periplasmic adaptor subunit n=1 Tax=Sphingomonas sp. TaxID=28214 RepID=UPI0028A0C868|nr:efflux RND transporter periplasmic adaptor subunit [Sphingomonas sp.]